MIEIGIWIIIAIIVIMFIIFIVVTPIAAILLQVSLNKARRKAMDAARAAENGQNKDVMHNNAE